MANEKLNGTRVAILITDGFEQVEMTEPRKALDQAGAKTCIVSPADDRVRAWKFKEWGKSFRSMWRLMKPIRRTSMRFYCPAAYSTQTSSG